ncbi:MAG: bifunctional riboflavin kinase/FAD synthetase [Lachnospira sp.]|nr:bifunctional riboflavin kinase/FAD synthetase [Lachnospira sp.]
MRYIQSVEEFELEKSSAVTLGKFDGVHLGHQKLLSIVKEKAREHNLLAVMFTFDRLPLSICPQRHQHFLTTNSERKNVVEQLGLDALVEYPFTEELMNTEPEDFIKNIIVGKLKAKFVVVGTDYRFGKGRAGDYNTLLEKGPKYGLETIVVEKERYQDREISSTYVREELASGHMETVNVLLGRPYSVRGIVCPGNKLGRELNIPTMNIYPTASKLLPPNGVYASITTLDGVEYYGVSNLGTKPTVNSEPGVGLETHLFNYNDDAYAKRIEVRLMHYLRQEMKFESVDLLKKQMESDVAFAKSMFLL